jgi:hypothetical protein
MGAEFEHRLFQRIRVISRILVIINWLAVLVILLMHGVPRSVAMGAFNLFRGTAVCATLWLLFETVEAFTGRTSGKNPLIDAALILPVFGFWFLVWVSSF